MEALGNITELIQAHSDGDESAYDEAIELLYTELRRLAHRNLVRMGGNPTLQTTAVVNEAYLKLKASSAHAESRKHFLNIASAAMRQIIVDYARARNAEKRGGDIVHIEFDDNDKAVQSQAEEILLVDAALKKLNDHNQRLARVFELKYFAGLEDDEVATAMALSKRTAQRDWMKARAYVADLMLPD